MSTEPEYECLCECINWLFCRLHTSSSRWLPRLSLGDNHHDQQSVTTLHALVQSQSQTFMTQDVPCAAVLFWFLFILCFQGKMASLPTRSQVHHSPFKCRLASEMMWSVELAAAASFMQICQAVSSVRGFVRVVHTSLPWFDHLITCGPTLRGKVRGESAGAEQII